MEKDENQENLDTDEKVLYNTVVQACGGNVNIAMMRLCKEIADNFDEESINFFIRNVAYVDAHENRNWFLH